MAKGRDKTDSTESSTSPSKTERDSDTAGSDQLDPVKMYLKRIGAVSLLDRAGEVEIAKAIEEGREALYETIFSSKAGICALLGTEDELEEGNVRAKGFLWLHRGSRRFYYPDIDVWPTELVWSILQTDAE